MKMHERVGLQGVPENRYRTACILYGNGTVADNGKRAAGAGIDY